VNANNEEPWNMLLTGRIADYDFGIRSSAQGFLISQAVFDALLKKLVDSGAWTEDRARADILEIFTIYSPTPSNAHD